jgi:para-nitrobenzyl esterase
MNRFPKHLAQTLFGALLLACLCAAPALAGAADCTGISTDKGPVTGVDNKGVCEYKGIPFAAPPVGDLRFRLPRPAAPWAEPLMADTFRAECYQTPMVDLGANKKPTGDEDCLYLNIWAPTKDIDAKKPVMLFIHGGGFQHGSGIMDTYYGARLAATGDVVVVTINYRLGPFGFFLHPALADPDGSNEGNYGMYDQVQAMKWVQANIASFGGDPGNVTLFGESAGGMSIAMHLTSPLAKGLFQKAIIESGPVFLLSKTIGELMPVGQAIAENLGCTDPAAAAECLRTLPAEDILLKVKSGIMFLDTPGSTEKFPSEPLAGGKLYPMTAAAAFRSGNFQKDIPVIIGTNKDEASFFVFNDKLDTRADFDAKLAKDTSKMEAIMGTSVMDQTILDFYDPDKYETPRKAYAELMGDMAFACPTRINASQMASQGAPVFLYHFTHEPEGVEMLGDWGAFHGSELPFVFGNMTFLGMKFPYANNKKVSRKVMGLWAGFAHTGVPSYEDAPAWPPYDPDKQAYMELSLDMKAGAAFKKDRCEAFQKVLGDLFK